MFDAQFLEFLKETLRETGFSSEAMGKGRRIELWVMKRPETTAMTRIAPLDLDFIEESYIDGERLHHRSTVRSLAGVDEWMTTIISNVESIVVTDWAIANKNQTVLVLRPHGEVLVESETTFEYEMVIPSPNYSKLNE